MTGKDKDTNTVGEAEGEPAPSPQPTDLDLLGSTATGDPEARRHAAPLKLTAKWTDDCSGKKDYDGEIVGVSTRYWPRGGGFLVLRDGVFEDNSTRPEIKPSAKCSITLRHGDDDYTHLLSQEYEGETFAEVAAQVERWAQAQFERVVAAVQREFGAEVQGAPSPASEPAERAKQDRGDAVDAITLAKALVREWRANAMGARQRASRRQLGLAEAALAVTLDECADALDRILKGERP